MNPQNDKSGNHGPPEDIAENVPDRPTYSPERIDIRMLAVSVYLQPLCVLGLLHNHFLDSS